MAEAALGDAAEERHLAAFEGPAWFLGAGAGPLALAAARAGFAHAGAGPAADAFLARLFVDAVMYRGQIHSAAHFPSALRFRAPIVLRSAKPQAAITSRPAAPRLLR